MRVLRQGLSILLAILMIGLVATDPAQAAGTDDYPFKNDPWCAAWAGMHNNPPTSPTASNCTNQYIDGWGFFKSECTSFVTWRMRNDNGFTDFRNTMIGPNGQTKTLGNASNWGVAAAAMGYRVDMNPAPGAIAWWGSGHVAWVWKVGNGVTIEEYNYAFTHSYRSSHRVIPANAVSGYIHFKDLSGNGAGSGSIGPDGLYHGTPPDGMIVENVEGGHLYVAAGGALFWFDRNNSYLWESFLAQRRRLFGEIPLPRMSATEVHALEANYPSPRHRVPRDNTYLYEIGNSQQHVVMYGYSFPVGVGDLDFLGGRDRAIMIPANNIQHFAGTPSIPNDVLLKDHSRPEVYHVVWNTLHHANNDTVVDCIKKVKGGALQPVPVSLMDRLCQAGRYAGSITGCSFPGHWAIHGPGGAERWHISGNNPYTSHRYGDPLSLHCRLGSSPQAVEISTSGVNSPFEGASLGCPNGTLVRIRGNGEVFQVVDGMLHYVPWPDMVSCLTGGRPEMVIDIEGPVVATTPRGSWAVCNYEGRQVMAPNGWVYLVKSGQKQHVPTEAVRDCLIGRSGTGNPIAVSWETVNAYIQAQRTAYCPYGVGANFVKEASSPTVWRITADGTRQHANGFCVVDPWTTALLKFRVWVVPDGEVAGHTWDGSVFAVSGESCSALPS